MILPRSLYQGKKGHWSCLPNKHTIDQAKFLGHPLCAAFIDLQKAYDSICRLLLSRKMIMSGLGPKFCTIVEDMYINASYRIKLGNNLGYSFTTNVGLRQGDPLSSLLFNLFIVDIIVTFTACFPPPPYGPGSPGPVSTNCRRYL